MIKNIIREIPPEYIDVNGFFDDDGLTENGGDFTNTLFILRYDRGKYFGFNANVFNEILQNAEYLIQDFSYVSDNIVNDDGKRITYKDIMTENGITYTPKKCHDLKQWAHEYDIKYPNDMVECIKDYLTITTGEKWETETATGYCQGDFVEMLYCPNRYRDGVKLYGEIFLGACREFSVIDINEDGTEGFSVSGYFVADCQAWKEDDYKKIVCEWADIDINETQLEMINNCTIRKEYSYNVY